MKKKNSGKIDITEIDLDKQKDKITDNPGLIQYPHHVGSALVKPEDKGKIRGRAMAAMHDQTTRQMRQIFEQMKTLANQAKDLKRRVEISESIYQAILNFEPVISHEYFLYRKEKGKDVVSMISPDEWGERNPFEAYLAKVKLLSDHTWEVLDSNEDEG